MRIKKGDTIKIIAGNDKGRQGKVVAVMPRAGKIVVEGMNIRKKHVRPKKQGQKGELVRIPAPFPISRAMLVCGKCGKATRAEYKFVENKKVRTCKRCGGEI